MVRDRIGVDLAGRFPVETATEWAAEHDVRYVDVRLDDDPRGLDPDAYAGLSLDPDVSLGLHTLSGVNVAERSPRVDDAVDDYLRGYVDVAATLDADRVIVHGGYHFGDESARIEASLDRLERARDYAADRSVRLLLENHNREPDDAEVHYLPVTLEQCERYFERLGSSSLRWTFNAPHARLFPEGMGGYLDTLGVDRCVQVRLNDNNGRVEAHLAPGEGTSDFAALFERLEAAGYDGHYMLAFGTPEAMLEGRDYLAARHPDG